MGGKIAHGFGGENRSDGSKLPGAVHVLRVAAALRQLHPSMPACSQPEMVLISHYVPAG
jgi:hypothetical protein